MRTSAAQTDQVSGAQLHLPLVQIKSPIIRTAGKPVTADNSTGQQQAEDHPINSNGLTAENSMVSRKRKLSASLPKDGDAYGRLWRSDSRIATFQNEVLTVMSTLLLNSHSFLCQAQLDVFRHLFMHPSGSLIWLLRLGALPSCGAAKPDSVELQQSSDSGHNADTNSTAVKSLSESLYHSMTAVLSGDADIRRLISELEMFAALSLPKHVRIVILSLSIQLSGMTLT